MKRRVTLQDIANELGYSKNTISLALRNNPQIPEATRERVRNKAEEMGYKTNAVVSHLMAQLRATQTPRFQAKLALINANPEFNALKDHPTIPTYVEGCERRAAQLGYDFDHFWLHDKDLTPDRLLRILKTRNIKGIVIVGMMESNELPKGYETIWPHFACGVTGVRTKKPTLSYCCVDHHSLALQAMEKALSLGYRRPALVLDDVIDKLVQRRFSAGYLIGQQLLEPTDRIPPFLSLREVDRQVDIFKNWLQHYKPDVVFTLYNAVIRWIEELGYKVPEDIGIIQLEWRSTRPHVAGMHQHNDLTGEAVVDMVITQIHNNEHGVPNYPRSTLIGATWVDGESVRQA